MPLTGELEHLPVVDVIQLIHSTRKSGTLNVYSRKGEGQLVFNGGYIVSATHSDEKYRIGQILCESNIITTSDLDKALQLQEKAGDKREPLIATLFKYCGLSKESAFKGLETLIELTIVEMLSWTKGIFSLEIDKIDVSDEYRYLPTQLQELNLDTQMVLLDALRIFDEKVHSGEITLVNSTKDNDFYQQEVPTSETTESVQEEIILSDDILGLADLDKIERKKPYVFKSLDSFEPAEMHRQIICSCLPELTAAAQTQLAEVLTEITKVELNDETVLGPPKAQAIVMLSEDEFLQYAVRTICQKMGILFFAAPDILELNDLIVRALDRNLEPVLVFDDFEDTLDIAVTNILSELRHVFQLLEFNRNATIEANLYTDKSLNERQNFAFSKPLLGNDHTVFIDDTTAFLRNFQDFLQVFCAIDRRRHFTQLRERLSELQKLSKAPEISLLTLKFIGDMFERCLTLIVNKSELIAERSIGILEDKEQGVSAPQKFRFQIAADSIFQQVVKGGNVLFDSVRDHAIENHLFHELGAPLESAILLAPLRSNGRSITLTYADFGNEHSKPISIDLIEFFFKQAGVAMGKALIQKTSKPQE